MKKKLFLLTIVAFLALSGFRAHAQLGVGTAGEPSPSAQLEVEASNRGVLFPRMGLSGTSDTSTITSGNVESLLIYNTATTGDVTPGYYYWSGTKWNRVVVSDEVRPTEGTVIYSPVDNSFTYINENGTEQTINLTEVIRANETITTLVEDVDNGTYTYTSEDETVTVVDIPASVINNIDEIVNNEEVKNVFTELVTQNIEGNVTFNEETQQFTFVNENGEVQTINLSELVEETITTLVGDIESGIYTYTSEDGTEKEINIAESVINNIEDILNNADVEDIFQTFITQNIEGNVSFNEETQEFTYVDENGVVQTIDLSELVEETITTLVGDIESGIYTYTSEDGTEKEINIAESVINNIEDILNNADVEDIFQTFITQNIEGNVSFNEETQEFNYVDENGNLQTIDIASIVKKFETNTSLAFDAETGQLTYINEDGDNPVIDLSPLNQEPWFVENTTDLATENTQNIYQSGNIGVGDFSGETVSESIDVAEGNIRIRTIGDNTGTIETDNVVVADTNGVLKTVASTSIIGGNYSFEEQSTGKTWIDGSPIFWKTINISIPQNTNRTVMDLGAIGAFTPNEINRIISICIIHQESNGMTSTINGYDHTTNTLSTGSFGVSSVYPSGSYVIIMKYTKS